MLQDTDPCLLAFNLCPCDIDQLKKLLRSSVHGNIRGLQCESETPPYICLMRSETMAPVVTSGVFHMRDSSVFWGNTFTVPQARQYKCSCHTGTRPRPVWRQILSLSRMM